ncbi:MAG TPA: DUF2272 domain-containing protein [Stellaceae bacterium]|nr:DUF2272 domain-containing protein [Stellaceae bacterium]
MASRGAGLLAVAVLLAGCARPAPVPGAPPPDIHIPPYAKKPYEPFSREAAVQIALREWRAFGQKIILSPNQPDSADSEERDEGLWQRVGDYWWQGLDYGATDGSWTGKHDQNGIEFPRGQDGNFAWSAAFIDYVMRMAGAGARFPYGPSHSDYINAARTNPGLAVAALPLTQYAPLPGDLICMWRARHPVTYDELPAGHFPGHCDIVVARRPGMLDVIGGNVDNAVAMKHVPVAADSRMVGPSGAVVDADYPWFVVLRVAYQR